MIQSILLAIVAVALSAFTESYFVYVSALVLGFLTFFYLKKYSKKEVLKTNLWSSLFSFIVLVLLLVPMFLWFPETLESEGLNISTNALSMIDVTKFLPNGLIFIILFNLPMLLYYFFGKKDVGIAQVAGAEGGNVSQVTQN